MREKAHAKFWNDEFRFLRALLIENWAKETYKKKQWLKEGEISTVVA